MFPFYIPWKKPEIHWFSGAFREYKMGALVRNELMVKQFYLDL